DGRLLGLHPIVMVLRERDADGRIVEGGHEVRDALSIAGADEGVRVGRGDLSHLHQEFPRAVRPRFEAVREVRDFVVALSEQGLVREGVVDAVEEMLPEDDVVRVRRRRVVTVAVGLVVIVVGDRAGRHADVHVFDRDRGQLRLRGLVHRHARPNAGTCQKDSVPQAFFLPSTASAMARAFSFGREQTAYSSPSKNTSRSGCCRWMSWIRCMMSLRVIDSSFGSIRTMIRFSLSIPTARPSSDALEIPSDSSERINTLPGASALADRTSRPFSLALCLLDDNAVLT